MFFFFGLLPIEYRVQLNFHYILPSYLHVLFKHLKSFWTVQKNYIPDLSDVDSSMKYAETFRVSSCQFPDFLFKEIRRQLEEMDEAGARFVCVGHINTTKIVRSTDCKWCGGRKLYWARKLSWRNDVLTNLARHSACRPRSGVWVFPVVGQKGMQASCWDWIICSSTFKESCWQTHLLN